MVKDDWPPSMTDQIRISPKILKLRFSLYMVKDDDPPQYDRPVAWTLQDDWPWRTLLHERPFTREGNYLVGILTIVENCVPYGLTDRFW